VVRHRATAGTGLGLFRVNAYVRLGAYALGLGRGAWNRCPPGRRASDAAE